MSIEGITTSGHVITVNVLMVYASSHIENATANLISVAGIIFLYVQISDLLFMSTYTSDLTT